MLICFFADSSSFIFAAFLFTFLFPFRETFFKQFSLPLQILLIRSIDFSVKLLWDKFKEQTLLVWQAWSKNSILSSVSLFLRSFKFFALELLLIYSQRRIILLSPRSAPLKSTISSLSFFKSSRVCLNFSGTSIFFFFLLSLMEVKTLFSRSLYKSFIEFLTEP